jgi:methylthioribose-1-phosphate isomerase
MIKTLEWIDAGIDAGPSAPAGVRFIDQRRLPVEEVYVTCTTYEEVADAIRSMLVRGAPAIGVAAAMGVALGALAIKTSDRAAFARDFTRICDTLAGTRPTAVNLFWAIRRMRDRFAAVASQPGVHSNDDIQQALIAEAKAIYVEDLAANKAMAKHGATLMPRSGGVLTHCNAGALATAGGYGTALGVIRYAFEQGKKLHVYADETRPVLQGSRLTAWELTKDGIPTTVIADNMAGVVMQQGKIKAVVVGADRIAANGDVANKIGTYSVAVLAHEHHIPFYVAAPWSTIDLATPSGDKIPIEQRNPREVTHVGATQIAPSGVPVENPAFDVTPAKYVAAIITERGIAKRPFAASLRKLAAKKKKR